MDLDSILRNMDTQGSQVKTASAGSRYDENAALAAALTKVAEAETANAHFQGDPVDGLMKMAEALASTEEERDLSIASMCGSAFADAAIAKLASYEALADNVSTKLASVSQGMDVDTIQKIAYDTAVHAVNVALGSNGAYDNSGDLQKLAEDAYAQGWNQAIADVESNGTEKTAAAEYSEGWDAGMAEVYNSAVAEFYKGAAEAEIVINAIQNGQG